MRCTTPCLFNPALFALDACRLARGEIRTDRPRQPAVDAIVLTVCIEAGFHHAEHLARTVPIDTKMSTGAAQRGDDHQQVISKRVDLFQICTTGFGGRFENLS